MSTTLRSYLWYFPIGSGAGLAFVGGFADKGISGPEVTEDFDPRIGIRGLYLPVWH
jgi:hypothetical protein